MIVRFWGVRGTLPVPGARTLRVGGNTSCVALDVDGATVVLDAGTGIMNLGSELCGGDGAIVILLSHPHWDHTMGMPYFGPLWQEGREVQAVDIDLDGVRHSVFDPIDGVHFPLDLTSLPARCTPVVDGGSALAPWGFTIDSIRVNHPGGAFGYRLTREGASLVYIPDNEIDAPEPRSTHFDDLVEFCRDADLLIHDAQFRSDEIDAHRGWGHSSVDRVCDLAVAAQVRSLALFHHHPHRTDDEVDAMEFAAVERLRSHGIEAFAAREGDSRAL